MRWRGKDWLPSPDDEPIRRVPLTPTEAAVYADTGVCLLGYVPDCWVFHENEPWPRLTLRRVTG